MATIVTALNIPLTSNTEGIGELHLDRTYVISILVTAVVAAPIVEETVFRGLILPGLLSRMPWVAAVLLQGVLFGAAHFDPARGLGNVGLVMILSAVGIIFGGAAYLLRRIGPTMLAHAILNAVVLTVVLTR
jgi:membrane protease YdiL (CAAX protease family)